MLCQIPDEASEFSCDSDAGLVLMHTAMTEPSIALAQPQFGAHGDLPNHARLAFLANLDFPRDARGEAVSPCLFDQDAPGVRVARFSRLLKKAVL